MQPETLIGRTFLGRYEILRHIGRGSMGQVFLAREKNVSRQVVVKVMHPQVAAQPRFREMFQREMALMARFKHPHSVELYESSLGDPSGPCIVMEYVPGAGLDVIQDQEKRLKVDRVGRILIQVCQALHAAHVAGIIHRDLKPSNLMVMLPGTNDEIVKIMDLGLASLATKPYISLDKLKGGGPEYAVGTPAYICPEQLRGDEIDGRSDIYSLGVVLFELLTGRLPFEYEKVPTILNAHVNEAVPKFASIGVTDVPPLVETVVRLCLEKFPNERPQTALELAQLYHAALGHDDPLRISGFAPKDVDILAGDTSSGDFSEAMKSGADHIIQKLEAWMPERIAVVKLRGFIEDLGGKVVESIPGLIRVRLGEKSDEPSPSGGVLGWLFGGKKSASTAGAEPDMPPVAIDLFMTKKDSPGFKSKLEITVVFKAVEGPLPKNQAWHDRSKKLYNELRSYLMAQR